MAKRKAEKASAVAPVEVVAVAPAPVSLDDAVLEGTFGVRTVAPGLGKGRPRTIVTNGYVHEHTAEDEHGRWVYSEREKV